MNEPVTEERSRTDGETDHSTPLSTSPRSTRDDGSENQHHLPMGGSGRVPQANLHRCELCRLVGVRRHQVDGPAHRGAITPTAAHLNTNRTLLRQGTHPCSAFFCAFSRSRSVPHLGHPIPFICRWSHPASGK